jgi:small conductance mechanosensitive channel
MQSLVDAFGLDFSLAFLKALFRIVSLLIVGLLTLKLVDSALRRVNRIVPGEELSSRRLERRSETLRRVVRSVGRGILGAIAVLSLAGELGYSMEGLLAGAGIAGLAVGFGAQSLVKDVLAGFFVILEDQYGVGDVVRIGNQEGVVEDMTLRVTVLRSGGGEVHVVPNGTIQSVTVLSKDWRRVLVDVPVSAKMELGRVFGVLGKVGDALAKELPGHVLDAPAVVGVERLSATGIVVRVGAQTPPARHGELIHEWRRRIKEAFDREGIEMGDERGGETP